MLLIGRAVQFHGSTIDIGRPLILLIQNHLLVRSLFDLEGPS